MWKPPSDPKVKASSAISVTATPPPVKVSATTTVIPIPTEDGSSPVAKTTTPTRSSCDSQARGAAVRKRIPIKIIDDEALGADKSAPIGIPTSTSGIKGSRRIEELQQSSTADPAPTEVTPKGIAKPSPVSPVSPVPLQAPPEELSAFLTEVSSRPAVSENAEIMKAKTGSSSSKATATTTTTNTGDQSRFVRVGGGGIWKKGSDNRAVLAERVLERPLPKQQQVAPNRDRGDDGEVQSSVNGSTGNATSVMVNAAKPPPSKPSRPSRPATLFEFERAWKACEGVDDRWHLLQVCPVSVSVLGLSRYPNVYIHLNAPAQPNTQQTIPATEFVDIFKNLLDPPFLLSILETFKDLLVNDQTRKRVVGQYFNALQRVPRFDTIALFLSSSEAQTLRDVQELLKV